MPASLTTLSHHPPPTENLLEDTGGLLRLPFSGGVTPSISARSLR